MAERINFCFCQLPRRKFKHKKHPNNQNKLLQWLFPKIPQIDIPSKCKMGTFLFLTYQSNFVCAHKNSLNSTSASDVPNKPKEEVNYGLEKNPISQSQVECLKNTQSGRIKYRKSIIHLGGKFFHYTQGLMAQLGLSIWCPNLDKELTPFYNTTHIISALTTFTKLTANSGYAYLKFNPKMSQDMSLLIIAYNNSVHYWISPTGGLSSSSAPLYITQKNKKKGKELRDELWDFAILNNLTKHYQDMLETITVW
ncbi:hypothetical protein VP01_171g2 [Puccinia sorghi]|uniref:Uncharacterized protein n=1 Tax=Puccinia sorghi TaxID=27349 RepID=A0A0L6VFH5_9BASI|nr:hypothetical protein VP01_171g2 [Puccinia sorghi]